MSKPRYHWWGYVRSMLWHYRDGARDETERREQSAVERALDQTASLPDGECRVRLVTMVFFDQTHTLTGAAAAIPCSYATAQRWQSQFIRSVAREYGLL